MRSAVCVVIAPAGQESPTCGVPISREEARLALLPPRLAEDWPSRSPPPSHLAGHPHSLLQLFTLTTEGPEDAHASALGR